MPLSPTPPELFLSSATTCGSYTVVGPAAVAAAPPQHGSSHGHLKLTWDLKAERSLTLSLLSHPLGHSDKGPMKTSSFGFSFKAKGLEVHVTSSHLRNKNQIKERDAGEGEKYSGEMAL